MPSQFGRTAGNATTLAAGHLRQEQSREKNTARKGDRNPMERPPMEKDPMERDPMATSSGHPQSPPSASMEAAPTPAGADTGPAGVGAGSAGTGARPAGVRTGPASAGARSVRTIARTAMMAAVTAVLAQVAIPLPGNPVPVTLQVLGVLLAGLVLPPAQALQSVAIYVALGAVGLPVFAAGRAGLHVLVGPTGGYLWGFIVGAYVTARLRGGGPATGQPAAAAAGEGTSATAGAGPGSGRRTGVATATAAAARVGTGAGAGMQAAAARGDGFGAQAGRGSFVRDLAACAVGLACIYVLGVLQLAAVANLPVQRALMLGMVPFVVWDLIKAAVAAVVAVPLRRALSAAS